ncbi:MAG: CvpA family protein [Lachnospiraceae bacterium]|nr:CvpA family protein [Lachnospiraceae bacterium]
MSPNALFLIIVAVLLICFFAGRRAGFIRTLIPVVSSLASIFLIASAIPILKDDIVKDVMSLAFADAIISVVAFAVSFLVLRWAIKKVLSFFRLISDAPVVGSVDRFLGALAGFAGGLIIVWGTFFFLLLFTSPEEMPRLLALVEGNEFVRLLYNNNLILTFVNYYIFAS